MLQSCRLFSAADIPSPSSSSSSLLDRSLKPIETVASLLCLCCVFITTATAHYQQDIDNDILQEVKKEPERQGKLGLPTNLLTNIAQDLITRSGSSSQVLSLNLTNLVILMVLKAIIFGATTFGLGHQGRSVETEPGNQGVNSLVTENELLLAMSYLKSDMTHKYGCLHRVACDNPSKAKEYLFAANMVFKGASIFSKSAAESRYGQVLEDLSEAVNYGTRSQDCSIRYTCDRG